MFEHIVDNIRQVVLSHDFLAVAQFGDAFQHLRHLFGRKL